MNNIITNKKIYIYTGSVLVAFIIMIVFILYPLYNDIIIFNQDIRDQRIQLAIYEQQRNDLEKSRKDYNNIKNEIVNISKIFIEKDQILNLIDTLDIIADANSIIQTINLSDINPSADTTAVKINIELQGNWENLLSYLESLETLDNYISLYDLNFTKKTNSISLSFIAIVHTID